MYGLIGSPLGHSYSHYIHEMFGLYEFSLMPMNEREFKKFIRKRDFSGLCITIPYKQKIMKYCDVISPAAEEIGAVNTLYFNGDKLCGTNTDYYGFSYMASKAGISFAGKTVLVMGSGGTCRTAATYARHSGAGRIVIASRSIKNAVTATKELTSKLNPCEIENFTGFQAVTYDSIPFEEIDIIVNTTPVGMYPDNDSSLIDLDKFPKLSGVLDVIYNPAQTKLVTAAIKKAFPASGGFPMLIAQAALGAGFMLGGSDAQQAQQIFTGRLAAEGENFNDLVDRFYSKALTDTVNIVLVGMPGCGKSVMGEELGKLTGKTVIDVNNVIEGMDEMSVSDILETKGEEYFVSRETEIIENAGKQKGKIIVADSTVVLNPNNFNLLKQNGIIVYLRKPTIDLEKNGQLLSEKYNLEALRAMARQRKPYYRQWSDIKCAFNIDPQRLLNEITEYIKEKPL